jgi:hypothetical protein
LRERPEKRKRLPGTRFDDEGKDNLRKGDKPWSHFGGAYLMRWFYVNLGRLLASLWLMAYSVWFVCSNYMP